MPLRQVFKTGILPLNRIEAFSDGVIAIIITILVLEIKVPDVHTALDLRSALHDELINTIPKILSYIVSFVVLAVLWVEHHHLFHLIKHSDQGVLWLNSLFLMCLALIPFPTGLIGEYPLEPVSSLWYGAVFILTRLSFLLLRWYVTHKSGLLEEDVSKELHRRIIRRYLLSPVLYAVATLLVFVHPYISLVGFAIIPLIPFYYFVPIFLKRHYWRFLESLSKDTQ